MMNSAAIDKACPAGVHEALRPSNDRILSNERGN